MANVTFDVLLRAEDFVAIDKPPGFHVHQPEFPRRRVPKEVTCLPNLRRQLGTYLYPVHRIDVATEGVLVFALSKPAASGLCRQFQEGTVRKTYFAIVRGWTQDDGVIDEPLALDSTGEMVPALTRYKTHARVELPFAIGKKHPSARYSLVEAHPESGRFHQIRRHMARISHPVIGDTAHGDSYHNRFFRNELEAPGLWLKAREIEFDHPSTGEAVRVKSPWGARWTKMHKRLGWREVIDDRQSAL